MHSVTELKFPWMSLLGVFALISLFQGCGNSKDLETPTPLEESLLIKGVTIVDPAANSISEPRDILIVKGRILEVASEGSIPAGRAHQVIEANGLFAVPGLIDVHAHIGDGGLGEQSQQDRQAALTQFVRYGVTTIFVPGGGGGNDDQLAEWKQQRLTGKLLAPGIYGSGAIITAPGSHPIGTIWEMTEDADPAVVYARGAMTLNESESVESLLAFKTDKGVDALKIVIEDGPEPWYPRPRLSKTKVAELVTAAHQRNLRVFAHVSLAEHVADGVAAGIDGIMHSAEDQLQESLLEEMSQKGIFYVATLALYDGFFNQALGHFEEVPFAIKGVSKRALASLEDPGWRNHPADPPDWVEPTRKALEHNLRRCVAHGVPLALGTDVNNPTVFPGYSAHEELALMVAAGLTPSQALQAATSGGASFLQLANDLGRIEPGFEADILLLHKNPLVDILHTRSLHRVISDGKVVDQVVSSLPSEDDL